MPLVLTTPFSPGDNNPGVTYPHVKIVSQTQSSIMKVIRIEVQIGEETQDGWVRGIGTLDRAFILSGQDYDTIIAAHALENEHVYEGAKRLLYQWLIDNNHFSGTVT